MNSLKIILLILALSITSCSTNSEKVIVKSEQANYQSKELQQLSISVQQPKVKHKQAVVSLYRGPTLLESVIIPKGIDVQLVSEKVLILRTYQDYFYPGSVDHDGLQPFHHVKAEVSLSKGNNKVIWSFQWIYGYDNKTTVGGGTNRDSLRNYIRQLAIEVHRIDIKKNNPPKLGYYLYEIKDTAKQLSDRKLELLINQNYTKCYFSFYWPVQPVKYAINDKTIVAYFKAYRFDRFLYDEEIPFRTYQHHMMYRKVIINIFPKNKTYDIEVLAGYQSDLK